MPENVRDRDELLLNAIVTGDTSGIDPRDREETFIKAIAEKINIPKVLTQIGTYEGLNSIAITIPAGNNIGSMLSVNYKDLDGNPLTREKNDILIWSGFTIPDDPHLILTAVDGIPHNSDECFYRIKNSDSNPITIDQNSVSVSGRIYRLT